jgi:hypothetical protein
MDNNGSAQALVGAVERILNPSAIDVIYPLIAFVLVIVLPVLTACWAIAKVWREKKIS